MTINTKLQSENHSYNRNVKNDFSPGWYIPYQNIRFHSAAAVCLWLGIIVCIMCVNCLSLSELYTIHQLTSMTRCCRLVKVTSHTNTHVYIQMLSWRAQNPHVCILTAPNILIQIAFTFTEMSLWIFKEKQKTNLVQMFYSKTSWKVVLVTLLSFTFSVRVKLVETEANQSSNPHYCSQKSVSNLRI